ncbi:ATP-dependent DNA ligase [Xylariomycetidae sp. FL2044]|nr:ATP-dependent DNA ligase [Xylariomycetidae sp. FL2044]
MSQRRKKVQDAAVIDEEKRQYATGGHSLEELDEQYPNRPKNHSKTLRFSELYLELFDPLNENRKRPGGPRDPRARARRGGHGQLTATEQRSSIVERFISRWRSEVGQDFYPALRLILPTADRDRGVYGLKESVIGKLLVKLMSIDRYSKDADIILNWKKPVEAGAGVSAGDFAGRCYHVLSKRPILTGPGDMTIADVNEMLDKLSGASLEAEQMPILETFYQRMNPEEMQWLIRIILKQMKVGATERTFLELWHPDAHNLFGVTSSLRRVCWELYDPSKRLNEGQTDVSLMQCFQPQLAQYQMQTSFQKMVETLNKSNQIDGDNEYWIEEKLDGERMQLHMMEDDDIEGGRRFCYWSRNAKNYTYLYGDGFKAENSSLTRHLKNAFAPGVRNIILDGEMITWDPELDKIMKFGTLKTAALGEGRNPHRENGPRPLFRVFDILYLNGRPLTQYTLRDRHNALDKAVPGVSRRLEVHEYAKATSADAIEPALRRIVSDSSEGLVIKNPRTPYTHTLGHRSSDWIKVKPDYMSGYGQEFDLVVIGGNYGSGHRGGKLSSFTCGLRVTENDIAAGANPEKCYSFLRVGGGFRAEDLAEVMSLTEGKWKDWDSKRPPSKYIELGGGEKYQYEKPDVWIRPSESIIFTVKGASVEQSTSFAAGVTVRFPRFKRIRTDRRWDSGLDRQDLENLRSKAQARQEEKAMEMEAKRHKRAKRVKRELVIAGQDAAPVEFAGRPKTKVFEGLDFCVLTECTTPIKRTKAQLENLIRENGGRISHRANPGTEMILVADKKVVKVASLIKAGADGVDIVRPRWILDCLAQSDKDFLLPFETLHLFHASEKLLDSAAENTDLYGDPYARDLDIKELRQLLSDMPKKEILDEAEKFDKNAFVAQLAAHNHDLGGSLRGHIFRGMVVHLAGADNASETEALQLRNRVRFGGGLITEDLEDVSITHVVILSNDERRDGTETAAAVRSVISHRGRVPRVVGQLWVEDCWTNRTVVDEERYEPM